MKFRVAVTLAVVACVAAAIKVSQDKGFGFSDAASAIGFSNPCAPVVQPIPATTTTTTNLCGPFNGQLHATSKTCCVKACGSFCGAINCQQATGTAPFEGYKACCTSKITSLCGTDNVKTAPCKLPRTISGAVRLIVANLAKFKASADGLQATENALAALFHVPVSRIKSEFDADTGGRRLTGRRLQGEAVNVNYKIATESNSTLQPATIAASSTLMQGQLATEMQAYPSLSGVGILAADLPTPASLDPGEILSAGSSSTTSQYQTLVVTTTPVAATTTPVPTTITPAPTTPATTTTPAPTTPAPTTVPTTTTCQTTTTVPTTTAPPTTTVCTKQFVGLIMIGTSDSKAILDSSASRTAIKNALASVLSISATAVSILGLSDGAGATVNVGVDMTVPCTMTPQDVMSKNAPLLTAIKTQFNALGVAATVTSVTIAQPQEISTTTTGEEPAPAPA